MDNVPAVRMADTRSVPMQHALKPQQMCSSSVESNASTEVETEVARPAPQPALPRAGASIDQDPARYSIARIQAQYQDNEVEMLMERLGWGRDHLIETLVSVKNNREDLLAQMRADLERTAARTVSPSDQPPPAASTAPVAPVAGCEPVAPVAGCEMRPTAGRQSTPRFKLESKKDRLKSKAGFPKRLGRRVKTERGGSDAARAMHCGSIPSPDGELDAGAGTAAGAPATDACKVADATQAAALDEVAVFKSPGFLREQNQEGYKEDWTPQPTRKAIRKMSRRQDKRDSEEFQRVMSELVLPPPQQWHTLQAEYVRSRQQPIVSAGQLFELQSMLSRVPALEFAPDLLAMPKEDRNPSNMSCHSSMSELSEPDLMPSSDLMSPKSFSKLSTGGQLQPQPVHVWSDFETATL